MHLSSPIPSFLVIVHDGQTIKTGDTLFGELALEAYKQSATDAGYQLWIKSLDDVVRECSAFEPMKEALSSMVREFGNQKFNVRRDFSKILYLETSRKALSLATSNPA